MTRTFSELSQLTTFEERFQYLMLGDKIGEETFGFDRYLNQMFYSCPEWKSVRDEVIIRDNGCDLGMEGFEIYGSILIHHMNPIRVKNILNRDEYLLNPEYLITTCHKTHNAIHYGSIDYAKSLTPIERKPGDTCPWK